METQEIAVKETAKENPLFTVVKDGNGIEHKIANFNNPIVCPQSGIFTIEAIRKGKHKQADVGFTVTRDPESGIIYGILNDVDYKTRELRFRRIRLGDMEQYDCSIASDRAMWCAVSHSLFLEGSPLLGRRKPLYKMHDREEDARRIIRTSKDKRRAAEIAENLVGSDLYDMAINLGKSTEHNSFSVLLAEVIKEAELNPKNFLDIYENSNREIITVFNRCRAVGLIETDLQNGFMWKKSYPLGMSEAAAHATIIKNPQLLMTMDMESKEKDHAFKKYAQKDQLQTITPKGFSAESQSSEYLTSQEIYNKLKELEVVHSNLAVENNRQKELNDKLELFLSKEVKAKKAQSKEVEEESVEDLQEEAHSLGFAKARAIEDAGILKAEIAKRKK